MTRGLATARRPYAADPDNRKALSVGCCREALIEADERQRRGLVFGDAERRRELESISRPQWVCAQQAPGMLSQRVSGLHLMPMRAQGVETPPRQRCRAGLQRALTLEAGECRVALDQAAPPGHHFAVGAIKRPHAARGIFGDQQWDDARAIPEPHRPDSRSSSRALSALAPRSAVGGGVARISLAGPPRPRRRTPARSKRASLPAVSVALEPTAGSRRATGTFLSVITTVSPWRTLSIRALKRSFVSDMLAIFIWPL